MKKKSYLLLSLLSLLTIMFCSIISNSNPVLAVKITGTKNIVKGVSVLQFNGSYGTNGHALFNVNLVCADGVTCQTLNPNGWSCWLHTAGNTLTAANIGEIHVANCANDSAGTNQICDVWLIPNIDYTTQDDQYKPADSSKVKNGYGGARAYSQDVDTCNTTRAQDKTRCWGQQSVKGQVSVPVSTPPPPPPEPTTWTEESSTSVDTYYYITINYKRASTGESISCTPSPSPQSMGPYKVTATTTTKTKYADDGSGNVTSESSSSTTYSNPSIESVSAPSTICNGTYRYNSASPSTGPFTMNQNHTVTLYYDQVHSLTVTPRRIVGYVSMCNQGNWTKSYFDNETNTSVTITPTSPLTCNTGNYYLYKFDSHNNTIASDSSVHPDDTTKDSSARAVYRRLNTLTLKHLNLYNRSGDVITGDQSATAYDYENATISPVSNNFEYGGYEYQLYGYAATRYGTVAPNTDTSYPQLSMTSDVTHWAFYKKVLYLTIKPVNTKGEKLGDDLVARVLEGDPASIKTYTTIGNYTFKGFGADYRNPAFPSSYIYKVNEMHDHVTIYAVYETSDDLSIACPPTNGELVQSYVRNTRFDPDTWDRDTTYAKLGDTVSYCTGYDNKYPYWNFMYPDYDYLLSCNRYSNPGRATPLGYQNALNSQLYSSFSVDSNRASLRGADPYQLNSTQTRNEQQKNFKSTKRTIIKDYPTTISNNGADVGTNVNQYGQINILSKNTSTSYINGSQYNKSCGRVIDSLPRDSIPRSDENDFNTARAIFPYNFKNTASIDKISADYAYAGDKTELNINLEVNPKENRKTHTEIGGKYATVDKGNIYYQIQVYTNPRVPLYLDGDSPVFSVKSDPIKYTSPINSENKPAGDKAEFSTNVNIPDIEPGTAQVCFKVRIWPTNSDKDGTGTSTDVDGGWTDADRNADRGWSAWSSDSRCIKVASKPNLQAWGGNIITNGQISTNYLTKGHLYPYKYYPFGSYNPTHTFGSWGELGIIANQDTRYIASGAALAYPEGLVSSSSTNFSNFVPLTFANYDPTNPIETIFGNLHKTYTANEQEFDKNTLVEKYIYNTDATIDDDSPTLTLNLDTAANDKNNSDIYHSDNNVYYYRTDSDLTLNASTIAKNTTQVVHAKNKNIRITGDIIYQDQDGYNTLEDIPKLIIYAEGGTIDIDYNVTRIDAILIADTIITCSKDSGCTLPSEAPKTSDGNVLITNQRNRQTPLKINGTLIAKTVIPNRTYGAGRGVSGAYNNGVVNSITPAEIFNYDPSLYRWEQYSKNASSNQSSSNPSLITTYIKEVAPRY